MALGILYEFIKSLKHNIFAINSKKDFIFKIF